MRKSGLPASLLVLATALLAPPAAAAQLDFGGTVRNVLPPGQSGSVPPGPTSSDQLRLYDGLTPLEGNVGQGDVSRYFKTAAFDQPKGGTTVRPRQGLRIRRDRFGVPHVHGRTRALVMFGAGWVTAQDRGLFIETVRGPARLAALDAPGLDPFALATSLRQFTPSAQTERFLRRQAEPLREAGKQGAPGAARRRRLPRRDQRLLPLDREHGAGPGRAPT